jgi:PIN domain nuclease of toxin-antitoxin system
MKFIIDTHIFLWSLAAPARISSPKLKELETPTNRVYVSSITIAEIMIKASIGKLDIEFDPQELALQSGFELLDFTSQAALLLKNLPFHHKDPFDRMLICQSLFHEYPLMTDDKKIVQYDCAIL